MTIERHSSVEMRIDNVSRRAASQVAHPSIDCVV
jgi:hypothetical protein